MEWVMGLMSDFSIPLKILKLPIDQNSSPEFALVSNDPSGIKPPNLDSPPPRILQSAEAAVEALAEAGVFGRAD
jgi:hypothetical protein